MPEVARGVAADSHLRMTPLVTKVTWVVLRYSSRIRAIYAVKVPQRFRLCVTYGVFTGE